MEQETVKTTIAKKNVAQRNLLLKAKQMEWKNMLV